MGYILDWERKEEKGSEKNYINVKDKAAMDLFNLHERERRGEEEIEAPSVFS